MLRTRLVLGAAGIALGLFGGYRLLSEIPVSDLVELAVWLVAAVVIHDGILSPIVVGVGWVTAHVLPPRARSYVQGGLIAAALVTVIAIPLIHREDSQPRSKAILLQNYGGNLAILYAVIAAAGLIAYARHVVLDHRARPAPSQVTDPP